jgi:hypothetical protein
LFQLALGEFDNAIARYDEKVRANHSLEIADLIDAAALLWRFELLGINTDGRWSELAWAWSRRLNDGFCTFNDVHAMLAFVGARDWQHAEKLRSELVRRRELATRHGETTSRIGLPACQAIIAFGRGDYGHAIELLGKLPSEAHRIGGSHAQRDVLYLTMATAIQRIRRPQWRMAA